jgi:hypothetical protein
MLLSFEPSIRLAGATPRRRLFPFHSAIISTRIVPVYFRLFQPVA